LKRLTSEIESLENIVNKGKLEEERLNDDLRLARENENRFRQAQEELRQVLDVSGRLSEDALNLTKKVNVIEVKQKQLALRAPSAGGKSFGNKHFISPLLDEISKDMDETRS